MEYQIVSSEFRKILEEKVNALLKMRWVLQGGVAVTQSESTGAFSGTMYYQAMVIDD